ncbi:hypothetical protein EP7_000984 [Isosphaeraceae bacterium EP7]
MKRFGLGMAGLLAALLLAGTAREAKAQNFFGSALVSMQAPAQASPQTEACYPAGCHPPACLPTLPDPSPNAIVPHPHPGTPGSSDQHCIVIVNGCPVVDKTYCVNKFYYVYYKIKNVDVKYDKIDVKYYPLPKVCSVDHPCPPCVAAGGYGKADHAGTIKDESELAAIQQTLPSPSATPAPATSDPAATLAPAPQPPVVQEPAAAATPTAAASPAKQWIWLSAEGVYGYGYQRTDGYWEIDAGSRSATLPQATTVAANK